MFSRVRMDVHDVFFFSYMEINDHFNLIVDFCQTTSLYLDLMSMFSTSLPCSIWRMNFYILYITAFFYRCFFCSHWYAQHQNASNFSEIVVRLNEKEFFYTLTFTFPHFVAGIEISRPNVVDISFLFCLKRHFDLSILLAQRQIHTCFEHLNKVISHLQTGVSFFDPSEILRPE